MVGVGMTKFGKLPDRSVKSLAMEAVEGALVHASISKEDIQGAIVGNCMWGIIEGQESIRFDISLRLTTDKEVSLCNLH